LLKNILEEKFQQENWTSELRHCVGPFSDWQPSPGEGDASDFTYFDEDQTLLKCLLSNGIDIAMVWQTKPLTFHIEVKRTTRSSDENFHLSRLQKIKAEILTVPTDGSAPEDIFLILRVYDLSTDRDGQPGVHCADLRRSVGVVRGRCAGGSS
jgi:hypothetical protein